MNKYCELYGYDPAAIRKRLEFLSLTDGDKQLALKLQREVLIPHAPTIIECFYGTLAKNDDFNRIMARGFDIDKLMRSQIDYLLSLGIDFDTPDYFEGRLQIGVVHAHVGVPLDLYECSYRLLRQLIIDHIPPAIRADTDALTDLIQFVLKITSLDMSLAIETYHQTRVYGLEQSLHVLRHEDQRLRRLVDFDRLTGVASRENILDCLESVLRLAKQQALPMCLVMADLDHFKLVNDRYGHQVGDQVLQDVAARMQAAVRDIDSIGRYGGEEFMIVLQNTSLETATFVSERIRRRVADSPINVSGHHITLTISQGLVEAGTDESMDQLITRADSALYRAKEAGRNRVIADQPDNWPNQTSGNPSV